MLAILFGLTTALGWGTADFIARFTGRALGVETALLGMLGISAVLITIIGWSLGVDPLAAARTPWLTGLAGIGLMLGTYLLYTGLTRGPVGTVAAIVGSYPALNLVLAAAAGESPLLREWLLSGGVLAGVVLVSIGTSEAAGDVRGRRAVTIALALLSAVGFAVAIAAGQAASRLTNELEVTILARWIAAGACLFLFLFRQEMPHFEHRWLPLLTLQGTLDGAALLSLFAAGRSEGAAIAVVVAASFSAVTILLARFILAERITPLQGVGIVLVLGGVAALAALRT